jgi:hypothetical protein
MKRVVQTLTLVLLVAGLTLPSVSLAGKIAGSGMIKHKAFTEANAPVQQMKGSTEVVERSISSWRIAIGSVFSSLRFPGIITIVIARPPITENNEPFKLQNPPWDKPPETGRPGTEDHGWGEN